MNRFLFFWPMLFLPIIFGWWFFIPFSILAVYLIKLPFEIVLIGIILDDLYYFGNSFWLKHSFLLYSLLLVVLAWFLSEKIYWRKII